MADPKSSIRYAKPIYGDEEIEAVVEALRSTNELQVGPRVREMEQRVADFVKEREAEMFSNLEKQMSKRSELSDTEVGEMLNSARC